LIVLACTRGVVHWSTLPVPYEYIRARTNSQLQEAEVLAPGGLVQESGAGLIINTVQIHVFDPRRGEEVGQGLGKILRVEVG
jgi:hypothetical protein